MADLIERVERPYRAIYDALHEVRETFHREGRISDANAKLDETVKLLAVHYGRIAEILTSEQYLLLRSRQTFSIPELNAAFKAVAQSSIFSRAGMGSIFGKLPSLSFEEGDSNIAFSLFNATGQALDAQLASGSELDILNEAFGHHVRDNFRSHIEDAQYMTPPEVVNFMVDVALREVRIGTEVDPLIVVDPSCGVGSFLTAFRAAYARKHGDNAAEHIRCIGQDKIERMVRLTALNFVFADNRRDDVFLGNTILDEAPLGDINGKVDLILTNPPFGARFEVDFLRRNSRRSTPFFATKVASTKMVDSELLFVDRYLSLLRSGGVCMAVVPDGVVSAKGTAALLRQHVARVAELISVIELPSVTFAQAGTRTKTAVLAIRKNLPERSFPVFFAESHDLGFQVSKRKGVPVKKSVGKNDLPRILEAYLNEKTAGPQTNNSLGRWIEIDPSSRDAWTPRSILFDHHSVIDSSDCTLIPLRDLTAGQIKRRPRCHSSTNYFISVLHIIGEGILDVPGIKGYEPVTPGVPVNPGEVIISRINPRIPRAAVVPDLGRPLLCSSEYEVIKPKEGVSPYLMCFLLLSSSVQFQIQSFTAGTSASHSRIKPGRILEALVPDLPSARKMLGDDLLRSYENACREMTEALIRIETIRSSSQV
jgi:type I restriction-modification system DNA methylase subunit